MPRWKTLPKDMDPQITEFTERMRRLVDHSGLSVAELADSTGYSRTSWERYLGGRLLAPKGAVVALAETTGAHTVDLTTLWELAERAWSRAESGHDSTMEAIRVARTRAAHDGLTPTADPTTGTGTGDGGTGRRGGAAPGGRGGSGTSAGGGPGAGASGGSAPGADSDAGTGARDGSGAAADGVPASGSNSWGLAGYRGPSKATVRPGSGSPTRPAGLTGPSGTAALTLGTAAPGTPTGTPGTPTGNPGTPTGTPGAPAAPKRPVSTGTPGAPAGTPGTAAPKWPVSTGTPGAPAGTPGTAVPTPPTGTSVTPNGTPATPIPNPPGTPGRTRAPRGGQPATGHSDPASPTGPASASSPVPPKRQQVLMFFAGMAGVLVIIAGVFLLTHRDGGGHRGKGAAPSAPSARTRPSLPPGVKCAGSACTGKDAEAMGCSGDLVTTAKSVTLGTTVLEVRYSRTCGTVWGRITGGAPGDTVRLTVGGVRQSGDITAAGDTIAYTPMAAVRDPARSRACATLASGRSGCTN
ncbi:DUF2690 domain-containing protein [Streptomyces sp. NPDC028722]|uniref:DUF2690 domain-containing protein n=1 Tax=Streptomyces sp. NPDC028722 TaxID=3155016 RepID=UPI0033FB51E2